MELVESIYSSDFLCAINILQFSVHKIHDKAIIYFKKKEKENHYYVRPVQNVLWEEITTKENDRFYINLTEVVQ